MKRVILIGKGRRVTLEELQAVAIDRVAHLQVHAPEHEAELEASTLNVETALAQLSLENDNQMLSSSVSIAVLTLLALNVSQGRLIKTVDGTLKAVSTLVDTVNAMVNDDSTALSSDPTKCLETISNVLSLDTIPLSVVERTLGLALGGINVTQSMALARVATLIACLSAERSRANVQAFAEVHFDAYRPHRGLVTTAATLRAVLNGSKYAVATRDVSCSNPCELIPQLHGPSVESLKAVYKTMELELNCFEADLNNVLDNTVATLALEQATDAVMVFLNASQERTGVMEKNEGNPTMTLATAVEKLQNALMEEAKLGCTFVQDETARVAREQEAKEAQKAARAAANNNPGTTGENEFEGKTEAQIAQIKKKRAAKLAKAQKKQASKQSKSASLFGTGIVPICKVVSTTNSLVSLNTIQQLDTIVNKLSSGGAQRKPKIAKGTRDYLPEQMMIRQEAFRIIRRVFESHGAVEIDTPVFELKDTLTGKYGEDSKLIYDLADQGGELLALRYDLTVPFARFLALNSVGNIKRFHIGKVYRRDQPALSKGRYREFYQCDFDIAGQYGRMVPDSECLAVVCDILHALPIGDFGIKLNHRRLLDAILDLCGVPADKFRTICSAVDKLDKEPWEEVKREMVQDKGLQPEVADKIGKFVLDKGDPWTLYNALMDANKFGNHKGAMEAMEDLKILFEYLEAMDKLKYISFDLSLARGLDYYTGVIYEAVCMSGNTQVGSIGGGGRYDNLVSMFQEAGKITPCVGVSVGIERVFTLMEARLREEQGGSIKQPNVKVLVATVGAGMMKERMKVTKLLWDSNISAEFSQQDNPKLKYEIPKALDRGIPYMVIVGEEEVKENKCKVKDLKAETEETVALSDLVSTLRSKGVIPVGCEFAAELLANEGTL